MSGAFSVFLGEVALDEYYVAPSWPGVGEKVTVAAATPQIGGTVANAASVYASYGGAVTFLYTLNASPQSDLLCQDLDAIGIDTSQVSRVPGLPESKTIIVLTGGEHTILIPERAFDTIELSPEAVASLHGAQFIYSTPLDAKMIRSAGMDAEELIASARARGARLVLDLDVGEIEDGDDAFIDRADILFVNAVGARVLRERRGDGFAETLLSGGAELVVVTTAEHGCSVHTAEGRSDIRGIEVTPVDVTGAGDTFCSSFCFALGRGVDPILAAEFANMAAARSVTVHGPRGGATDIASVLEFGRNAGRPVVGLERLLLPEPPSTAD